MNRIAATGVAVFFMATASMSLAQEQEHAQQANDEVAEGRAMVQAGREQIIRDELPLSDEEAAVFWPVYAEYQAEMAAIMDRYTAMLTEYVQRYDAGDLDDDYAEQLLEEFFGIKRELLEVQMNYVPTFKVAIPSLKVAQFFQLENKITADIDSQLAIAIPLISQ